MGVVELDLMFEVDEGRGLGMRVVARGGDGRGLEGEGGLGQ